MNIICGLPRSGSTLLCNILNQNPRFHATSTSPLVSAVSQILTVLGKSPEIKGELALDRRKTENKIKRTVKALCDSWHRDHVGKEVFDKNRAWLLHLMELLEIYPDTKIIVTVRDLRDVFASIEKQNRKTALLHEEVDPSERTLEKRLIRMFSKKGLIGIPLMGIKDCILRQLPIYFLKYEEFIENPEAGLNKLYCFLMEEEFEHDLENVENTAQDPDYLYLNKYPHTGSGKVEKPEGDWSDWMAPKVAEEIMSMFKWYNQEFGYA